MNWETILFLGDSLTFGARSYMGYPEYCGDILSQKLGKEWNIINHSVNGFCAIDLARSISDNYATLSSQTPLISIILIGTNDAKKLTDKEDFRIALEQVIIKAKLLTLNKRVLLLKIPGLIKGVSYPYNHQMNESIEEYNQILQKLAVKHQIGTLAISLKEEHFYDGVHFNKDGNVHFAKSISEYILQERGL